MPQTPSQMTLPKMVPICQLIATDENNSVYVSGVKTVNHRYSSAQLVNQADDDENGLVGGVNGAIGGLIGAIGGVNDAGEGGNDAGDDGVNDAGDGGNDAGNGVNDARDDGNDAGGIVVDAGGGVNDADVGRNAGNGNNSGGSGKDSGGGENNSGGGGKDSGGGGGDSGGGGNNSGGGGIVSGGGGVVSGGGGNNAGGGDSSGSIDLVSGGRKSVPVINSIGSVICSQLTRGLDSIVSDRQSVDPAVIRNNGSVLNSITSTDVFNVPNSNSGGSSSSGSSRGIKNPIVGSSSRRTNTTERNTHSRPNGRSNSKARKPQNIVVGKKVNDGIISLRGADLTASLYIGYVDNSVSLDDLKGYIESLNVNVVELDDIARKHNRFKSFRLCLRKKDLETIKDPNFWPEGIVVRRFFQKAIVNDGKTISTRSS